MGTRRLLAEAIHAAGQAWIVAGAVWRHLIRRGPNPEHTCTVPAECLFSGMLWGALESVRSSAGEVGAGCRASATMRCCWRGSCPTLRPSRRPGLMSAWTCDGTGNSAFRGEAHCSLGPVKDCAGAEGELCDVDMISSSVEAPRLRRRLHGVYMALLRGSVWFEG